MHTRTHGRISETEPKDLDHYVQKFTGQIKTRQLDIINQIRSVGRGMASKRLTDKALINRNALKCDARAVA